MKTRHPKFKDVEILTENYVEEYEPIVVLEDFTKNRKVEVFLGEATGNYSVNITENGEWSDAVFITKDRESALKSATHILINGIEY